MIKFTTCFPMVGGCPGTLASSATKIAESGIKTSKIKNKSTLTSC